MFWDKYCALCTSKRKAPNVVASEIGIKSSGTVTGWKNGAIPRASVLMKISEYFGVPVSYLTDETDKKEKPTDQQVSELDDITRELRDIWDAADHSTREAILAAARMFKARGN